MYLVGICIFMSIVLWAQVAVFTHVISDDVDDWDKWFLGRAPRTREALSHPGSWSDPIGGSELSSGCENIYWDSLPA